MSLMLSIRGKFRNNKEDSLRLTYREDTELREQDIEAILDRVKKGIASKADKYREIRITGHLPRLGRHVVLLNETITEDDILNNVKDTLTRLNAIIKENLK